MTDIFSYLKDNILIFDGGMGTLCSERIPESAGTACELLNLTHGDEILKIHKEYIDAGSLAIKTNTFGANAKTLDKELCKDVIKAGFGIANSLSDKAYVFADIGPVDVTDCDSIFDEYKFVADVFLDLGAKHFLFETNSSFEGLYEISEYIKSQNKEAFILTSFACLPDGFTREGKLASTLIKLADECEYIDAVGLNCASGARHMAKLCAELKKPSKPFSVMPNAGYPTVLGNRTFYDGDPSYFGRQTAAIANLGAKILGGCCGTTPLHIESAVNALKAPQSPSVTVKTHAPKKVSQENKFWNELCDAKKRPFAVELDPPENADIEKFISGAKQLQDGGASVITIADCPIARARMDSSLLSCMLKYQLGIDVIPHMTCRDRNINATKALLLGLCAQGVHNVLAVTGDPIPSVSRDEVKSVYNFNSRMLAEYITSLGESTLPTPFRVFGALNVNARNFDVQLNLAKQKEQNGMCGFLTQPVMTERALENLKRAKSELKGKILGGIFPIVSHKNACFMNSEVSGVEVDERIIELYKDLDRQQGEDMALKISAEIANVIYPYVDGFYLMTPFSRTQLVTRIMDEINSRMKAEFFK